MKITLVAGTLWLHAKQIGDTSAYERADDAEHRRHKTAHRVAARHKQSRKRASDKSTIKSR